MQHKNLLSQQIQLNFIFYVYKETNLLKGEIQAFQQSPIPFGFAVGLNCESLRQRQLHSSKQRTCLLLLSPVRHLVNATEAYILQVVFLGKPAFCDLQPQPEEVP